MTTVSVVIPTYRRTAELERCLAGLKAQTCLPDEVVVVARVDDDETHAMIPRWADALTIVVAEVGRAGLVQALNCGLGAASGDIVAFTDDDAIPRREWIATILDLLSDPSVAAVGGPDVVRYGRRLVTGQDEALAARLRLWRRGQPVVGHVQPFGRVTSNHHAPGIPRCDVEVLKGVNMAFRRGLLVDIGFDERVRGAGSQVHNELSVCLPLRAAGWRIIYDPDVVVDHVPSERQHGDHREAVVPQKVYDSTFNEELSVWPYIGQVWRVPHVVWAVLVGTLASPGLIQLPRYVRRRQPRPLKLVVAAIRGRRDAIRLHLRSAARKARRPEGA